MTNDSEAQNDELMALESIYEGSFKSNTSYNTSEISSSHPVIKKGGKLEITIEPPLPFYILFKSKIRISQEKHSIEYLPPMNLHFALPSDYPSHNPPEFTLSCKWLNHSQLSYLCEQLDSLWKAHLHSEILFTWIQFLKERTLDVLMIKDYLDLENLIPKSSQTSCSNNVQHCDIVPKYENGDSDITQSACSSKIQESEYDKRTIQDLGPNTSLLGLLIEHDEKMRKCAFDLKIFECKICFTEKLGSNCIDFWPCHHVYCKSCIHSFFEVQIIDGNIKCLKCPEFKCESEANPRQVELIVSKELYQKYDDILLNTTLSSLGDIQPCPRKHCQYPVTVDDCQGECPSCSFVFCGFCRYGAHGVEKCKFKSGEATKILEAYMNGNEKLQKEYEERYSKKYLDAMVNEYLSTKYLKQNSKECPKCKSNIEKISGCNKMTCKRCNTSFCWLCEEILDKVNPYWHFNTPQTQCFNRLFFGVHPDDDDDDE